ncbi:MAG: hypothetical protein SFY81_13775 [Verrucomicrobiota bacterium]|nr:hypothetical protein [Verrucomicrobiota bacterium]
MSGLLFQYDYNRSVALYVCPGDKSKVRNLDGSTMPATRTRSYSMNGLWGGRTSEKQAVINKVSEALTPESTFVLIDENEDSIDDAHFLVWPAPDKRWVNMPAGRHGQSGILSFADGHVEKWQWLSAKSFRNSDLDNYWKNAQPGADQKDLERLQLATIPPFQ